MYAVLDVETTGGNPRFERITEIAIFIHDGNKVVEQFCTLINPEKTIPPYITRLTGITNEMVEDAPRFCEVAKKIVELTEGKTIVAHNAHFDYSFIREEFKTLGYAFHRSILCTVRLSRKIIPGHRSYSLGTLCERLGIANDARHRAAGDALATTRLFEILLNKNSDAVEMHVSPDPALMKLPPGIDRETVNKLPEETGVYYFYNSKGSIIYIGKSTNIRKRVLSHFAEKEIPKSLTMKTEISDVSYEVTGSELIALLLESDEIKKHKPRFNRLQRESYFQWGIFNNVSEDGYIIFRIARIKSAEDEPLLTVRNKEEAIRILDEQVEKYNLCQKLCGIYDIRHACFRHHVNKCNGACAGKEEPPEYNKRVRQLIRRWRFENSNFFILGNGRNREEKSVVAVENGRYIGFGYLDSGFTVDSPDQVKFFLKNFADNRDVQRIIRRHLQQPHTDKVITY
jgi:DNA polymerase-3 subunit epsilon